MKQTIYLLVDQYNVKRMTKNVPATGRGEHVLKVEVEIKPDAFRDPLLTKQIVVEDWREGIDISDVDLKNGFITEEEAKTIRESRLQSTIEILKAQGYNIEKKVDDGQNV